ncbi:MAG: gamma-glutamyltransferase [Acidobacteriota bacterium]
MPVIQNVRFSIWILVTTLWLAGTCVAQPVAEEPPVATTPIAPIANETALHHPEWGRHGMVVSQHELATEIGVRVLESGGNAIDAATAIGFALAVVLPRAGNLGGGGFMLVHDAETSTTHAVDFRETAPAAAHRDLYLDGEGEVDFARLRFSRQAVGVPGTVAGLLEAHARWGSQSRSALLTPAIELARDGFAITRTLAKNLDLYRPLLDHPSTLEIFFPGGDAPATGETLVQRDLAWSLEQIAMDGADAFYRGAIARRIVADMEANHGLITRFDLAAYEPRVRRPVQGDYRGYEVFSMPPPSSGGVHLIQMLEILEGYDLTTTGIETAATFHRLAETMKMAYADRGEHLGDPDFVDVPVAGLTSPSYAATLRATIDDERARPASEIRAGRPAAYESPDTTHFSVMDADGNAVAVTYTINYSFGSGIVAQDTGILLNNEMDDFSAKPGVPNAYGLVGGDANAVAAGKRPLSSMTPVIVLRDGAPVLITGSPDGSRIITTVLQVLINVIDFDMNIAEATNAPRVHHQWLPDELRVEPGISPDTIRLLEARGHTVVERGAMGSTQSIHRTPDGYFGAADPRRPDARALGVLRIERRAQGEQESASAVQQ